MNKGKWNFFFWLFGHKPATTLYWRKVHDGTCKKHQYYHFSARDHNKGHYVWRTRVECVRCGKRLDKEKR